MLAGSDARFRFRNHSVFWLESESRKSSCVGIRTGIRNLSPGIGIRISEISDISTERSNIRRPIRQGIERQGKALNRNRNQGFLAGSGIRMESVDFLLELESESDFLNFPRIGTGIKIYLELCITACR